MDVANIDDEPDDAELDEATKLLGPPEAVFCAHGRRTRYSIGLGLALLIYSLLANYFWWTRAKAGFGHLEFHFLVMPFVIGVGLLVFVYRNRGLRVAVFATGVLRLRPNEAESVPFDEVSALHLRTSSDELVIERDEAGEIQSCHLPVRVPRLMVWEAWVELQQSEEEEPSKFRPAINDFPQFAALVQRKVFERLWPPLLAKWQAGEMIAFADLELRPEGLTTAGKTIPWSDVKALKLEHRILSISRRSSWRTFWAREISTVPNAHLLVALVTLMLEPTANDEDVD